MRRARAPAASAARAKPATKTASSIAPSGTGWQETIRLRLRSSLRIRHPFRRVTIEQGHQKATGFKLVLSLELEDEVVDLALVARLAIFDDLSIGEKAAAFRRQDRCARLAAQMLCIF